MTTTRLQPLHNAKIGELEIGTKFRSHAQFETYWVVTGRRDGRVLAVRTHDGRMADCSPAMSVYVDIACPDCGAGWPEAKNVCPNCSLSREALEDAAAFLTDLR